MRSRRDFLKNGFLAGTAGLATSNTRVTRAGPLASIAQSSISPRPGDVVLENQEARLIISSSGIARSLWHKNTGQECLVTDAGTPIFTATQYRPYENELQLRYPAKAKTFPARSVRQKGDRLLVEFELVDHEVTIKTVAREGYFSFAVEKIVSGRKPGFRAKRPTPLDEICLLQLPVWDRKNFGEWLNVLWDESAAVCVLGTDPYPRIDAVEGDGFHILQAVAQREVKLEGVGAAIIVTDTDHILERIGRLEEDFDLPNGAESRRRKEYPYSYYWVSDVARDNIDTHLHYAKLGGFRTFMIYYTAFAQAPGHYLFREDRYPRGLQDLQEIVEKIKDAGLIPGLHHHYNKAFGTDPYITPAPDPRLNLKRVFTLARDIDSGQDAFEVEENPEGCYLDSAVKVLKLADELVEYESYTVDRPFRFLGCKRGAFGTQTSPHRQGLKFGLLGEVSGVIGVYDQKTGIQEEVAQRLGQLYTEAGFEFAYFDGAEDVPPPYWYNVSRAQWLTWKQMNPRPLFSEGACKSHFSWHILTRGNAFDIFRPEVLKDATRAHPAEEAPRIAKDFTGLNFGWIGYWEPGEDTIGTQPDMLEFVTSRAAAWDCPISFRGLLEQFKRHPRTPDNLEVLRRWEEVRVRRWLTSVHKEKLKNLDQEHILLVNQSGGFELVPYCQIARAGNGDPRLRAFLFEYQRQCWVVYWRTAGSGRANLELPGRSVRLWEDPGRQPVRFQSNGGRVILPVGGRRYVECRGLSQEQVKRAFREGWLS
jgi:hypothetical protein